MFCGNCGKEVNPNAVVCVKCGAAPRVSKAFCQNCGQENRDANAVICVSCGSSLGAPALGGAPLIYPSNPPKDPALMALLSGCFIAGTGQIIMGQAMKGLAILFGGIVLSVITAGLGLPVVWIVSGIDAYMIANKLKSGRPVGQWEFF
jgi:TM2 domain-containing membrane protein YozV